MSLKSVIKICYPFAGGNSFTSTADANGFKGTIVKTAGSPTAACISGGGAKLLTDGTSEAQSVSLTMADVLPFPASNMERYRFELGGGSLASATHTTYVWGLGSALNTTLASMSNYIVFTCNSGSNSILISASDGTHTYTGVSTGVSLPASGFAYVGIDFTQGLSDVRFLIDNGTSFKRVALSTTFNLSAMAGDNLQPVFFNVKTSSADVAYPLLRNLCVEYRAN